MTLQAKGAARCMIKLASGPLCPHSTVPQSFYTPPSPGPSPVASPSPPGEASVSGTSPPPSSGSNGVQVWVWVVVGVCAGVAIVAGEAQFASGSGWHMKARPATPTFYCTVCPPHPCLVPQAVCISFSDPALQPPSSALCSSSASVWPAAQRRHPALTSSPGAAAAARRSRLLARCRSKMRTMRPWPVEALPWRMARLWHWPPRQQQQPPAQQQQPAGR